MNTENCGAISRAEQTKQRFQPGFSEARILTSSFSEMAARTYT
jgi:hypothetical protein